MPTLRFADRFCRYARILFLASLGEQQITAPPPVAARAPSSEGQQRLASRQAARAATGTPAVREIFRQHCVKCHKADGTGGQTGSGQAVSPNFTVPSWQARRSDAQLLVSILDGKGDEMPPWRGKFSQEQARGLVVYVRSFAPTTGKSAHREPEDHAPARFDERFRRLLGEFQALEEQSRKLSEGTPGGARPNTSSSRHDEADRQPAPAPHGNPAARELFRKHCAKCHGADGTGKKSRGRLPEIPDFTQTAWQAQRNDAQLTASILDGKGDDMPGARGKLGPEQARGLVAYVRTFAPRPATPAQQEREGRASTDLEPAKPRSGSVGKPQSPAAAEERSQADASKSQQPPAPRQSVPAAPRPPAVGDLFRRRCVKCHGADGTGSRGRERFDEIPDFTKTTWQARRSDAQLLASVLDGKGEDMPPSRGKISPEQARRLVAHVRSFASTPAKPGEEEQEGTALAESAEVKPTRGLVAKLIRWLGKFHPATVHFPVALLTAAAVAEILRMITATRTFDAVTRYCVWFGALTAIVAGALGWFLGGFRLADSSRVTMTHRWLGTSTVAFALLALTLIELGRRPGCRRARMWSRVTLLFLLVLVSITGFFGGAIVYGLDHYRWPK
jgi:mono/diheme cytochrome c family protein/uncharacterized membrane protein